MEFFGRKTNIDFLGIRRWSWGFSILLILFSFVSFSVRGLNWGLDFTGGYEIQVSYPTAPDLTNIRKMVQNAGFIHSEVISFGSSKEIMIRLAPKKSSANKDKTVVTATAETEQQQLTTKLNHLLGRQAMITSVDYVGPEVGAELAEQGLLAMLVALLATMIYIAIRFELKFAVSAAIALAHDPIVILGVFSLFQLRFDLTSLAAVLAVIGYSLNDTVVVYDRIRENFRKLRKVSVTEVVNRAINDTLSRTVMTSGLTLLVVVVLFCLGGPSLHNFALALIIGVVVGTYSSIYVAGALAVAFGLNRSALVPAEKKFDDSP
jgi:preprotein translocase subunit SecF